MHTRIVLLLLVTALTNVQAQTDESFVNYDSIISELSLEAEEEPTPTHNIDWDSVAMHGGLGLITSWVNYATPEGLSGNGLMKGFEAHIGMNLFSRKARAEGIFRRFAHETVDRGVNLDLRDFEARIVFLPQLRDRLYLRMGGGLSFRRMNLDGFTPSGQPVVKHSSTMASGFVIGFEKKIAPTVSVGSDLAYRSTMERDSFDRSSVDASLRLDATF